MIATAIPLLYGPFATAAGTPQPSEVDGPAFNPNEYRLGSADRVKVTVFNETTLSGDYAVSGDGTIAFPLIGNVRASGRTPVELQTELQRQLADGYLVNPSVSVEIETFRPFYITGEVNHPGEFPYSNGLTVMKAVALAQGYTYRANKKHIFVSRNGSEIQADQFTTVQPGDTIRIAERYF